MIRSSVHISKFLLWSLIFLGAIGVKAQDEPNFVDLGIRFISSPPPAVKINQVFGIQAEVYLDSNTSTVPAGEVVTAEVTLVDPSGIVIQTHNQTWNGFNEDTDGAILNEAGQLLLQVPWSQANKWTEDARWKIVLRLTASAVESDLSDNLVEEEFPILLPDLDLSIDGVTATDPLSGSQSENFVPNTNYTVKGTVYNKGDVMTQPSVRTSIVARLRKLNEIAQGRYSLGEIMDEESIVFPAVDDPLLYLPAKGSTNFEINNLYLPADATGKFVVTVEVNPSDIPAGRIMYEMDYATNVIVHPSIPIDSNEDGEIDYYEGDVIDDHRVVAGQVAVQF